MKCDDFLPNLETGGIGQRLLARLHAVRCRRCAAVRKTWVAARGRLESSEPLTLSQRRAWARAADEAMAQPLIRLRLMPTAVVTALAACLLVAVVWTVSRTFRSRELTELGPDGVQIAELSSVREISVSEEFANLETRVEQLKLELAKLEPQADLLDARHQVNELLNQYSKW